jgi:predicted DNA-binding transcriptional regulator AlpA
MEILTIAELAAMLKMNKRQIYSMTDTRSRTGSMKANPLPFFKINGNIRFRKADIEAWIDRLVVNGK